MPVQNYTINTRDAVVGQTYGLIHTMTIHSAVVEGAGVAAGLAVQRGSVDRSVAVGGGAVANLFAVCVLQQAKEASLRPSDGTVDYVAGDEVAILREGFINVIAIAAVTAGDPVYVNDTTGAFYQAAAAGRTLATNMSYETSVGAGEIAVVKINLA